MQYDADMAMKNTENFNLFCFPFVGGSYYSYNAFDKHMAGHVNLVKVDLPGHGKRIGEPLLTDIDDMVFDLFRQIEDNFDAPNAFHERSLGALYS